MKRILLILCVVLVAFTARLYAQETPQILTEEEASRKEQLLKLHYVPASFRTLAQLTWRYGMHPITYDEAIDRYIKIINCPLYNAYYGNDFLWQRVREGIRNEIKNYSPNFPDRFEIRGGVELGRYDFKQSAFMLSDRYSLTNAGHVILPTQDGYQNDCYIAGYRTIFPVSMNVFAENPFTFEKIPVAPQEAKALLQRLSKFRYMNTSSNRMAMLRIRLKITGIKNYNNSTIGPSLTFRGQLDEIAVFEDPQMTKPIWIKNFKDLN